VNCITQHIPSFVDCRDAPESRTFETLAELEAVPFVARWKTVTGFLRFSKSEECLMAEIAPDKRDPAGAHWVVGFLRDPAAVDLPQWVETEGQRARREQWNAEARQENAVIFESPKP
jgi:hypothetical protein